MNGMLLLCFSQRQLMFYPKKSLLLFETKNDCESHLVLFETIELKKFLPLIFFAINFN